MARVRASRRTPEGEGGRMSTADEERPAQVFVQPSYGTPEARRYWAATLAEPVSFRAADHVDLLDPVDLARLTAVHPGGRARFWGATPRHDKRMDTVATGDV